MNELNKAYNDAMKKYELGYEKIRAYAEDDIKREIINREEQISAIKEMHWSPRLEERMVKTIIDGSEKLITKYRETAEDTISSMRKNDSARCARLLGIPDPLANS